MGRSVKVGYGSCWTSVTPYLHPWHIKKNFTVEDQIRRECRERGLPEIRVNGRKLRPIHFHRFRSKRGFVQPDTHGSFWHIELAEPMQGPLALGSCLPAGRSPATSASACLFRRVNAPCSRAVLPQWRDGYNISSSYMRHGHEF